MAASLLAFGFALTACHHAFPPVADHGAPSADLGRSDAWLLLEAGVPDAPPPPIDGLPAACASSGAVAGFGSGKLELVVCEGDPLNGCAASSFCAPGWKLCRPSEYGAIFPAEQGPPPAAALNAWLSGCVEVDGAGALSEESCAGDCSEPCGSSSSTVATGCSGTGTVPTDGCRRFGVVSSESCWKVGSGAAAGHWVPRPVYYGYGRSLCCRSG